MLFQDREHLLGQILVYFHFFLLKPLRASRVPSRLRSQRVHRRERSNCLQLERLFILLVLQPATQLGRRPLSRVGNRHKRRGYPALLLLRYQRRFPRHHIPRICTCPVSSRFISPYAMMQHAIRVIICHFVSCDVVSSHIIYLCCHCQLALLPYLILEPRSLRRISHCLLAYLLSLNLILTSPLLFSHLNASRHVTHIHLTLRAAQQTCQRGNPR